jgi:hypothetical protein
MGAHHEQESNAPLIPMDPFPHLSNTQRDPPPYQYMPLTPESTESAPTSPTIPASKTVLVPPPIQPAQTFADDPVRLDSRDPLSSCDTRFANIILNNIILPRLRVGVMRYKDRESFEYVPKTKDDVRAVAI